MSVSPRQAAYLSAMGIDLWRGAGRSDTVSTDSPTQQSSWELPRGALPEWLLSRVVAQRHNVRPAVTQFVIVSEWRTGESSAAPLFADEAGVLLDAMFKSIMLSRDQVGLIGLADQKNETGVGSLADTLANLPLKVVLFMSALPENHSVESFIARGIPAQICMGVPLIASLHPAYMLANPRSKRTVWEDLKQVRTLLMR